MEGRRVDGGDGGDGGDGAGGRRLSSCVFLSVSVLHSATDGGPDPWADCPRLHRTAPSLKIAPVRRGKLTRFCRRARYFTTTFHEFLVISFVQVTSRTLFASPKSIVIFFVSA